MRPLGLLLAACLCCVLLYDRLAGHFPGTVLAAAPGTAVQSSLRRESRLEKLQHFDVLLRLIAVEDKELTRLEELRGAATSQLFDRLFRERLEKQLQSTWDRMNAAVSNSEWRERLPADKRDAIIEDENKRRVRIREIKDETVRALKNPNDEFKKALNKGVDESPVGKEYLALFHLVALLEHERDAVRDALLRD
jgi:hypothetical protein